MSKNTRLKKTPKIKTSSDSKKSRSGLLKFGAVAAGVSAIAAPFARKRIADRRGTVMTTSTPANATTAKLDPTAGTNSTDFDTTPSADRQAYEDAHLRDQVNDGANTTGDTDNRI